MEGQPQSQDSPDSGPPAELFERHRQMIFRYILKQVGDPDVAEDLLQETFIRYHGGYASLKDKDALGGWLRSIAGRLCIDHFRSSSRQRSALRDQPGDDDQPSTEPADAAPTPLQVVEKSSQST